MKIKLKHILENDAPKGMKLPKYIRRARGFAHLASICTQPKDATHECRGFDLGIAFFRDGTFAAILWKDYTLDQVRAMHAVDKYAKFVLRGEVWNEAGGPVPVFAKIVTTERAETLAGLDHARA
jgi:hypothetical protein